MRRFSWSRYPLPLLLLLGGPSAAAPPRLPDAPRVAFAEPRIAEGYFWLIAEKCSGGHPVFTGGCFPDHETNRRAQRLVELRCIFSFRGDRPTGEEQPGWADTLYVQGAVRRTFELKSVKGTLEISVDPGQPARPVRFVMNRRYRVYGSEVTEATSQCTGTATGLRW